MLEDLAPKVLEDLFGRSLSLSTQPLREPSGLLDLRAITDVGSAVPGSGSKSGGLLYLTPKASLWVVVEIMVPFFFVHHTANPLCTAHETSS